MTTIKKYGVSGNNFFILERYNNEINPVEVAPQICNNEYEVETNQKINSEVDGILWLKNITNTDGSLINMKLVEPDGSISPMCGNGLLCTTRWAYETFGYRQITIQTESNICSGTVLDNKSVVELESPSYVDTDFEESKLFPNIKSNVKDLSIIDSGVVHVTVRVSNIKKEDIYEMIVSARDNINISDRINLTLWDTNNNKIRQRTFEYGVEEETYACGTGALAIAFRANELNIIDESTKIHSQGGCINIEISDKKAVLQATVEKSGEIELEDPLNIHPDALSRVEGS